MGDKVYDEPVSRKWKSKRDDIRETGTIVVIVNDVTTLRTGLFNEESLFSEKPLKYGPRLLNQLERDASSKRGIVPPELREAVIKRRTTEIFVKEEFKVLINVTHNMWTGEESIYVFTPYADIITIKDNYIIGIEVKGYRSAPEGRRRQIYMKQLVKC